MEAGSDPFGAGPLPWCRPPRSIAEHWNTTWARAAATMLIGWLPLVVIGAFEHLAIGPTRPESILLDLAIYGRYLIAAPVLAAAGVVVLPELTLVVRQFTDAGFIRTEDRPRFDALLASTRRLLASRVTDVVLLIVAYSWTVFFSPTLYPSDVASWVTPAAGGVAGRLSMAGWWRTLISQPLFLILFQMWVWRLLLWIRFLARVSRMNLRTIPVHPDGLAGLRFVLIPARGFSLIAFALGAISASSIAESVISGGVPLYALRFYIGGQVIAVLALLAGPFLLLMRPLFRAQVWGMFHYGRVATEVGRALQQRWTPDAQHADREALHAQDFSATTDLFSIVANIYTMNLWVLNLRLLAMLAVAALLPYVPVVLAVMPIDRILQLMLKALV